MQTTTTLWEEILIVAERGEVTFYDAGGPQEASRLAPAFPAHLGRAAR